MEDQPPSPTSGYSDNEFLICASYARKFVWEDKEHVDEEEFYSSDEEVRPNTFERVKRFLRQVRESKGYDVDCYPPSRFSSPFMPLPGFKRNKEGYEDAVEAAELAIRKINGDLTDKTYKLVDVEKVVWTRNRMYLLTFTAKEVHAGAGAGASAEGSKEVVAVAEDAKEVQADAEVTDAADAKDVVTDDANDCATTFQAMVFFPFPQNTEVVEWKKKGVPVATGA